MDQTAEGILRNALAKQMEKEAAGVPPDSAIWKMHTFSELFLKNMERLKGAAGGFGTKQAKKPGMSESQPEEESWKKSRMGIFGQQGKSRLSKFTQPAALCACLVLAAWLGCRGLDLYRLTSENRLGSAADTSGAAYETAETAEETVAGDGKEGSPDASAHDVAEDGTEESSDASADDASDLTFAIAGASMLWLQSGSTGMIVEITDEETIAYITDNINSLGFSRGEPCKEYSGYSYSLEWYDSGGHLLESIIVNTEYLIRYNGYFYTANGEREIDTAYLDELLSGGE